MPNGNDRPDPSPEQMRAHKLMLDLVADLADRFPAGVVAQAAFNVAARCAYDTEGLEGAQTWFRRLADDLPNVITEEGRLLCSSAPRN